MCCVPWPLLLRSNVLADLDCHFSMIFLVPGLFSLAISFQMQFVVPFDVYGMMIVSIYISWLPFSEYSVCCMFHFHFILMFLFESHREYPLIFRLAQRIESVGVLVYRQTMASIQSTRPILVISAECICSLLLSILGRFEGAHIWCLTQSITTQRSEGYDSRSPRSWSQHSGSSQSRPLSWLVHCLHFGLYTFPLIE